MLSLILQETFYTKAVADPGFPRWGKIYNLESFFRKLYESERDWKGRDTRPSQIHQC